MEKVESTAAGIVPTRTAIVASDLGEEAALWGGLLTATAHARDRLRRDWTGPQRPDELRRQAASWLRAA